MEPDLEVECLLNHTMTCLGVASWLLVFTAFHPHADWSESIQKYQILGLVPPWILDQSFTIMLISHLKLLG